MTPKGPAEEGEKIIPQKINRKGRGGREMPSLTSVRERKGGRTDTAADAYRSPL